MSLGHRNVSSIEFDKSSQKFAIKKTWTFFSDKIKIISENDGDIMFLNSEKKLCITNLNNQSLVKILSDKIFDQAIMVSESVLGIKSIAIECDKKLLIIQTSGTEIIQTYEVESDPILVPFSLRGKYLVVYTVNQPLILYFNDTQGAPPFEIFNLNLGNDLILDVLSHEEGGSLNLLTFSYSEPEGRIQLINTANVSKQSDISFSENYLSQSKMEFGRYLCFSGKLSHYVH